MTLRALSASQAERFDPEQVGGCKRRWYYQNVQELEVPQTEASKEDGHAGHALFAMHYRFQGLPKRARMLKAVRGAIAKGELPVPAPGMLVESRFDGQPAQDANGERLPLDTTQTLWLGGMPWDGYVDLRFYREGTITVLDHKFSSDIHAYAKPADQLLSAVQMPVYALDSLRLWPEAQHVELIHHYVSRKGVDSFLRRQLVMVEQVRQRGRQIERLVAEMLAVSQAKSPDEVPGNRASCHTWNGCPFQSRCTAFKEKPKMDLNPEEQEWLSALGGGEAKKPTGGRLAEALKVLDNAEPAVLAAAVDGLTETEKALLAEFVKAPPTAPGPPAATELETASAGGTLSPDDDPFAVFAPVASTPQEQPARPPSCGDCGAELNAENGSQRDGVWKHIGCPAKAALARRIETVASASDGPKCPDCPHPAHAGTQCTGKRGRGACRCEGKGTPAVSVDGVVNPNGSGAVVVTKQARLVENVTQAHESSALAGGHLATCVQNDAGKWLRMEGCPTSLLADAQQCAAEGNTKRATERIVEAVAKRWSGAEPNPPGNLQRGAPAAKNEIAASGSVQSLPASAGLVEASDLAAKPDASERERAAMRAELETLRSSPPATPATGWSGTLQVNVNLGPETLALLQRILGVKP